MRPSFDSKLSGGNQRDSMDESESITVDSNTLKRIFDRLNQLEQQQTQINGAALPNNIESRIAALESTVEHIKKSVIYLP